jgi:N-acetylglucosamine-6-phosphate deacetylase
MSATIRIVNATLLAPEPSTAREVTFREGRIVAVGSHPNDSPADITYDARGAFLTPGLVDALVHGGDGKRVMTGDPEELHAVARAHGRNGTTAFCCGTFAAPMETLRQGLRAVGEVARNPPSDGARVLGAYVEGKFGTPEDGKHGAHDTRHLEAPTREAFLDLWNASGGSIRVFSYAVERDVNLDVTRFLASHQDDFVNVVPTMGHTNATYDATCRAIDAGVRRATHTFNGMSGLHHRKLGAAEAVLDDPRVHAEVIGDGRHVHPTWARLLMKLKGANGTGLITDAGAAAALSPQAFQDYFRTDEASGLPVTREGRRVYLINGALYLDPQGEQLTGGFLTLNDAVRNAIRWGASPSDAVRMATLSPAENLKLKSKGALRPGFDADLAVFDADWNPLAVFVEGRELVNRLAKVP